VRLAESGGIGVVPALRLPGFVAAAASADDGPAYTSRLDSLGSP